MLADYICGYVICAECKKPYNRVFVVEDQQMRGFFYSKMCVSKMCVQALKLSSLHTR